MRQARNLLTPYGKEVRKRLVDLDQTPGWLVERVSEDTGLYFDHSYLCKIVTGKLSTPKIINSINKILDIGGEQ